MFLSGQDFVQSVKKIIKNFVKKHHLTIVLERRFLLLQENQPSTKS